MGALKAMARITSIEEAEPHRVNRQRFGEIDACRIVADTMSAWFADLETTRVAMRVLTHLAMEPSNRSRLKEVWVNPRNGVWAPALFLRPDHPTNWSPGHCQPRREA